PRPISDAVLYHRDAVRHFRHRGHLSVSMGRCVSQTGLGGAAGNGAVYRHPRGRVLVRLEEGGAGMGLNGEELMAYSVWLIARETEFPPSHMLFAISYKLLR